MRIKTQGSKTYSPDGECWTDFWLVLLDPAEAVLAEMFPERAIDDALALIDPQETIAQGGYYDGPGAAYGRPINVHIQNSRCLITQSCGYDI